MNDSARGPFRINIARSNLDSDETLSPPFRNYDCKNYEECLTLAAAMNWESYTCTGCCGEVNASLCWQAHHAQRKDELVQKICHLPELEMIPNQSALSPRTMNVKR